MGEEVDTFVCGYWSISSDKPTELCQLPVPPASETGKIAYYIFRFYRAAEEIHCNRMRTKPILDKRGIEEREAAMLAAWTAMPLASLKATMYNIVYNIVYNTAR